MHKLHYPYYEILYWVECDNHHLELLRYGIYQNEDDAIREYDAVPSIGSGIRLDNGLDGIIREYILQIEEEDECETIKLKDEHGEHYE